MQIPGALGLMPAKFKVLATYNAETSRGIMHTPKWRAVMAGLQAEFDSWQLAELQRGGAVELLRAEREGKPDDDEAAD